MASVAANGSSALCLSARRNQMRAQAKEGSDLTSAVYPANTFVTCSADASIRLWNIDPKMHRYSKVKIPYCKDVYKVIDTSVGDDGALPTGTAADPRAYDLCTDIPDTEQPYRIQVHISVCPGHYGL